MQTSLQSLMTSSTLQASPLDKKSTHQLPLKFLVCFKTCGVCLKSVVVALIVIVPLSLGQS
ncbi:ORF160 [White spot syndrome virus]|uniref:ORF160 n=1 Tax=White spot syndrome virus TaxID=342409 RepID=A0A2D3I717_9VIRU|nr:ORF160 [White spot syndrome virus]